MLILSEWFDVGASFFDVGAQILAASGWRPDCAMDMKANVAKSPPTENARNFVIIEPSESMRHSSPEKLEGYQACPGNPNSGVTITARASSQDGVGSSCASKRVRAGLPGAQGWIVGKDAASVNPPASLQELSLLHAMLSVDNYLREATVDVAPPFFLITTGSRALVTKLMAWFNEGSVRFEYAVASDII